MHRHDKILHRRLINANNQALSKVDNEPSGVLNVIDVFTQIITQQNESSLPQNLEIQAVTFQVLTFAQLLTLLLLLWL